MSDVQARVPAPAPEACKAACPRCGAAFHCGVTDTAPCACAQARLDDAQRATLAARFTGCLCGACLQALAAGAAA